MVQLRYADETYVIRRLLFQVRNELKLGWSEEIYHQALLHVLLQEQIPVISKPRHWLIHREQRVHLFEPDLIVWNKIILELKALPYTNQFTGEHYAQLTHYLKYFDKGLGLLVNFCAMPIAINRVLWDERPFSLEENYTALQRHATSATRLLLPQIRELILAVAQQFGFGYPETVYRRLLAIEFSHHNLTVKEDAVVPVIFHDGPTMKMNTQHILVNNEVLLHIRSLLDKPSTYDYARTKNYLTHLSLPSGLVVNFGRNQLQIEAINP